MRIRVRHGRRAIVLSVVVTGLMTFGPTALAKGPSQAVLSGPGLPAPVSLREPSSKTIGQELADIVQFSGFFYEAFGGKARGHRPSGELGPQYTVTYTMSDISPPATLIQHVYPFADVGPVTTMARGQTFWGTQHTPGGWFHAKGKLKTFLIGLGVPEPTAPSPGPAQPSAGASSGLTFSWGILAAIVVLATAAMMITRRAHARA